MSYTVIGKHRDELIFVIRRVNILICQNLPYLAMANAKCFSH